MCLLSGLGFEQRLSTGTSVGVGVRDAANFGIWSVSRKYSTSELLAQDVTAIQSPGSRRHSSCQQLLAVELVTAACIDPSGNIRRGSSAALQELIGRHPDTILEGIPLVQAVDYHAIARRSRAILEVAESAAKLGDIYWESILDGMLEWRGLGAPEAESRRQTAQAIGRISALHSFTGLERILERLLVQVSGLSPRSIELRHGYFLGLASVIVGLNDILRSKMVDLKDQSLQRLSAALGSIWTTFEQFLEPSRMDLYSATLRPELTAECCCVLLSSLSTVCGLRICNVSLDLPPEDILTSALKVLSISLSRTEDIAIQASSHAASNVFAVLDENRKTALVNSWLQDLKSEARSVGAGGRRGFGHVAGLGAIYRQLPRESELRELVFSELLACVAPEKQLELRVAALQSVERGILSDRGL
jgi:tubulin-specific chaperone D